MIESITEVMARVLRQLMTLMNPVVTMLVVLMASLTRATEWCPQVCTCYRQLTITDCSGRHLHNVPTVPNVTLNLYLENNRIENLIVRAFFSTPNLTILTLHGNQLTLLDSSTFDGLHKLQVNSVLHCFHSITWTPKSHLLY